MRVSVWCDADKDFDLQDRGAERCGVDEEVY